MIVAACDLVAGGDVPLVLLGLLDATHSRHNVLRNYPVIGHLRHFAEFIRPNIQQYFINTNQSGRTYPREIRDLIAATRRRSSDQGSCRVTGPV
tara:strand:+ start:650 stop:931 length:282 start_codon:yes stop_codon:yes gene_type:complete